MSLSTSVRLFTLGECRIEVGEHAVLPSAPHVFAALLYLGLERGRWTPRATLSELLFPEDQAESASHNLRQLLYKLRRLAAPIESNAHGVRLPERVVHDDISIVVNGTLAARREAAQRGITVLPAYAPPTRPYSRWLETRREWLHQVLVRALAQD